MESISKKNIVVVSAVGASMLSAVDAVQMQKDPIPAVQMQVDKINWKQYINPDLKYAGKEKEELIIKAGEGGHTGVFRAFVHESTPAKPLRGKAVDGAYYNDAKPKERKDARNEKHLYLNILPTMTKQFQQFVPKSHKTCWYKDTEYLVMDDLNLTFQDEAAKANKDSDAKNGPMHSLDFKVGFDTAMKEDDADWGKLQRHGLLDGKSTSSTHGFRLEGWSVNEAGTLQKNKFLDGKYCRSKALQASANLAHPGFWNRAKRHKLKKKFTLFTLKPKKLFGTLFQGKSKDFFESVRQELEKLTNVIKEQEARFIKKESTVAFVGSSVMVLIGEHTMSIKFIDFAHLHFYDPSTQRKPYGCREEALKHPDPSMAIAEYKNMFDNYYKGLKGLYDQLDLALKNSDINSK